MRCPVGYVPIDISSEHLANTARGLQRDYPKLEIHPLAADFTQPFELPASVNGSFSENPNRVIYFPGSIAWRHVLMLSIRRHIQERTMASVLPDPVGALRRAGNEVLSARRIW